MEDRDWLIIKTLYNYKNITKTAKALFISQPSLTARIHHIEDEFGVKLICRGNRGIRFTLEGDYLAKCAQEMLVNVRKIKENVINMGKDVKGTLRLAAPIYLTKFKLPRLLGLFKEQYPDVEFDVINAWSNEICSLLYKQEIHVGFVRTDYGWQGGKHILHEEPICIVSKQKINFSDLPNLPRIDYHTDYSYKNFLDSWWNDNFSQPPKIGMKVSQLDICKNMVINGLGYGIMPSTILNDHENIYRIYITDREGKQILRKTWILYQQEILALKTVKLFIDFAKTTDFNKI